MDTPQGVAMSGSELFSRLRRLTQMKRSKVRTELARDVKILGYVRGGIIPACSGDGWSKS